MGSSADCNGIVTIKDHAVRNGYVRGGDIETISVEWKGARSGVGVNDGITNSQVFANESNVLRYRL